MSRVPVMNSAIALNVDPFTLCCTMTNQYMTSSDNRMLNPEHGASRVSWSSGVTDRDSAANR